MSQKILQSIFHANVNVDLIRKNVIQINVGTMIHVDMNVNNIIYAKIMFGILLHVIVKMVNT